MDRIIERAYNDIVSGTETLKDEILMLEKELSDLQDKYDTLKEEVEEKLEKSYQKGYNDGAIAAATDILN